MELSTIQAITHERDSSRAAGLPPHAYPMMPYLPGVCPSPRGGALLLGSLGVVLVHCCTQPKREGFLSNLLVVQ